MKSPPRRAKKGRLTYTLICGERIAHWQKSHLIRDGSFHMRRFSAGSYERPCNAEILAEFL